jgi:hypothetical protein
MERYGRGDLILGMSLAEVFVLLAICALAANATSDATPVDTCPDKLAACEQAKQALEIEKTGLIAQIELLQKRIDWLLETVGCSTDQCVEGIPDKIAGRAAPKCDEENVLLAVQMCDGTEDVELRRQLIVGPRTWEPGARLRDSAEIDALLAAVDEYSRTNACRFDFLGRYGTDADYRRLNERYQPYLYPGGRYRQCP